MSCHVHVCCLVLLSLVYISLILRTLLQLRGAYLLIDLLLQHTLPLCEMVIAVTGEVLLAEAEFSGGGL